MKKSAIFITGIFVITSASAYDVKKGDSLSAIAQQHYGNWGKWKDIWKSNEFIKNPNLIYPGQKLSMEDGIPGNERLLVAANDKNFTVIHSKKGSQEWSLLPEQSWEKFVFKRTPEVDPDGFDRRSRVAKRVAEKTTATITVASDRLAIEGEIINARTEYGQIFLGEQVFIRAEEQLQVGTVYTVSSGPQKIISKRDKRVGFAYDLAGKIKIVGVRDGLFIGTVIAAQRPIYRNNLLIPEVKALHFPKPVASPNVIAASVMTTEFLNSSMLGEQQLVILDVGSNEGVKPGMIFRHYLKNDPSNGERITTKDYLIESEIEVLDVKDQFSTGIILASRSVIRPNDEVLSLMDLKDFQKNMGMQTFIQDYDYTEPLDELDQLDDSQGLGEKENLELRQLEKVDPNDPNLQPNVPVLGDEPAPNDQVDKTIIPLDQQPKKPEAAPVPEDVPPGDIPTGEIPSAEVPAKEEPAVVPPATDADLDVPADIPPVETPAPSATPAPEATPAPTPATSSDDAILDVPTSNAGTGTDLPADLAIPPDPEATASPSPTPAPKK